MPGEATWQGYAGDNAYNAILGGMSTGEIVLASLAGYWTGEFTNSFTLAKMKILTNYVFKCGVEALMTPVTYAVVNGLKRVETEDYYDRGTNFNPFVA